MQSTIDNYHKIIVEVEDYAFLLLDKKGIIRDWNKGAEKLKGYTAEEIIGENFKIFYTKEDCKKKLPEKLIKKAIADGKAMDEGWRVRKDGSCFWGSILITALHDDDGKLTGFLKITRDLTERKNTEEKLRHLNDKLELRVKDKAQKLLASEKQLRYTMDNMLEGIQIHDFNWRYIYVNEALVNHSTYQKKEELLGHTLLEIYPGIDQTHVFRVMQRCMNERVAEHIEIEFDFPNGTKADFELSIQPVPEGIFILSVDITEKKKAQEKIVKANRLYAFLSGINQSIVHIKEEQDLFDRVCNIAIEIGQFKMAWIGMVDAHRKISVSSLKGDNIGVVTIGRYAGFDYEDPILSNTLMAKALRTGKYAVNNDMPNDPEFKTWREDFIKQDVYAGISLPIFRSGKVAGFFTLQAGTKDFFDESEIQLLEEAVTDISFALENFDKERLRVQAEVKVSRSEDNLKKAQAVAHLGNWEIDPSTDIAIWSDENCRIFGLAAEDNIQSTAVFLTFIHPEDLHHVKEIIESSQTPPQNSSFYCRIIRRDGAIRYVNVERRFELDAQGLPKRIYGICHDITEQKLSEENLRRNESKLKEAQSIAKIGSWEIDMVNNNLYWSDEQFHLLGYKRGEVEPSNELFFGMIHPDDAAFVNKNFTNTMQVLENSSSEFRIVRRDGAVIYAFCEWKFEFDKDKKPLRIYGIVQDVTEAKKAENEIRELNEKQKAANQQLSTILNTLPANIALLDENGIIIAVDEAWKKFANDNDMKARDYGIGDNYLDICEKATGVDSLGAIEMATGIKQVLQGALDGFALEYPCHSPAEARWFRVEVRPLEEKKNSGAVVMHINITEQKLAENEIKSLNENLEARVQERTAELSEANKALETFSYSVSHDLRAPVRSIMGFAKILQECHTDSMDDESKELFKYINDNGKRANAIMDDLLKLAKYDRVMMIQEPVDMMQMVESIWSNISLTNPHHAELKLSRLPTVLADKSMIEQVVINLVSNAIKYSSKKENPQVSIWSEYANGMYTFYVKDNGAGFDMAHYGKLFEAFQRLHGMSEYEGTGVGLTLVKRIIDKHGGTVGADAKVDEGATFYFTLPADAKG